MKEAIFVLSNPNAPRLCPELACEIGLNESILFLQIEFWIRTSNTEEHDGKHWTYQSVRKIKEFFPFWSISTINRAVQSIIDQGLVIEGNFNIARYDRTRWFAINPVGVSKLKSIRLLGHETPPYQNDTRSNQIETRSAQNETTIPESTTENSTESTGIAAFQEKEIPARPNIFVLYEQNIGLINPMISEELKLAETEYPTDWIEDAFKQCVLHNKRNWAYAHAILKRWQTEGRGDRSKPKDAKTQEQRDDEIAAWAMRRQ